MLNFGKCKCLHPGHGNEDAQYTMGGTVLNITVKEKDLELSISADMKVSEQCVVAALKENQILGLINGLMVERVQRRATKMTQKFRNISDEMRLKQCGLTTLETRRRDQIEVFKILKGYENIDRNVFFFS